MRIVTYKRIKEFIEIHADSENSLNFWYHTVMAKNWDNINELRQDFNTVDYVGNHRFVFNIKGNDYRLVAIISFNAKKVYIRFIGTHSEYDKIKDIKTFSNDTDRKEYNAIVERIEELLQNPDNIENKDAKGYVELSLLSDLVADYEERHYPVKKPSLIEVVKLRMAEMGLNQKRLSELLGVSTSRVSEYLNGKSEPTLKVAREISRKLNIDASIVLGI